MMDGPLWIPNGKDNSCGVVRLPQYFRDALWADEMGVVQKVIDTAVSRKSPSSRPVIFDFSACRWIDPLPLMSVLLEIAHLRTHGLPVEIRLPSPDAGPAAEEIAPYQRSPNRLLGFLDREGFLESLTPFMEDSGGLRFLPAADRSIYRALHGVPTYEDAHCIPMTLFAVPSVKKEPGFAQQSVEQLVVGVDSRLDAKVAPRTKERLIYKLRVALQEGLHNTQEHAYDESQPARLIAVYVRYRTGGLGLGTAARAMFEAHAREERLYCPGLNIDWLRSRSGCLEVFFLDRGRGMVRCFELADIPLSETHRFNQVMWETFLGGRSSKPERHTLYGGLHLLHNLLRDTGDFIRALDDGTWFASSTPVIREQKQTHRLTKERARLTGLAMHLRLAWKTEADDGQEWTHFADANEVWPELCLTEQQCAASFGWFQQQAVLDERFGECWEQGEQARWVLWLVRPHRMKWDILAFIRNKVVARAAHSATLIIADIPSYEAETYVAALAQLQLSTDEQWPQKFSRIVLCTNRLRFASVVYESPGHRHGYSKLIENTASFKIIFAPIEPRPATFRLAIVRWLKWHDSHRLWQEVNQHHSMFIAENVRWGQDDKGQLQTISGYIDFARTLHNSLCAAIYRAALARVLGIVPASAVQMNPLGRLTEAVLREVHSEEVYEPARQKPANQLALGSVLVSGSTLKASSSPELDLHFFVHTSSPLREKKPALLFWLPQRPVKEGVSRLARIGNTATIAPEGWKSFEVPRFDSDGHSTGDRDPNNTYKDWQDLAPVLVKAGHWCYEEHHDFLTINIVGAVEAAFLEKNDLARFLINRIFPFIGLTTDHVDKSWRRLLNEQISAPRRAAPIEGSHGLLVYRSHANSEPIVGRLLEALTKEGRSLAQQRIFSIVPVRACRAGSTLLIPPLVREEIRCALAARPVPVLIFDDCAVTGRTLNDLETALSALGARTISTLVIVNRLRQPAERIGESKLTFYWRLDVPAMGREGTCPLCHALHLAETFKGALATENARREISDWILCWEQASPLDNWAKGLRPLPLSVPERNKQYCYRQHRSPQRAGGEYLAHIDIFRSTGLAIHVSELHTMTGRDDFCLKKLAEHAEPEVRVELAAGQIFLFGNEFHADILVALVHCLVDELVNLKQGSPHVQLACLGVIRGLALLNTEGRRRATTSIDKKGDGPETHYAVKVLLAYLTHLNLTSPGTEAHSIGVRLLSTARLSLASRLRDLFLETLSPLGNPHSETIPLLLEDFKQSTVVKSYLIRDASDSLDRIADLMRGLDKALVRKDARNDYKEALSKCEATLTSVQSLVKKCADSLEDRAKASTALEGYVETVKTVVSSYFYRIRSAAEYHKDRGFESVLNQIIQRIDWAKASSGKVSPDGSPLAPRSRVIELSVSGTTDFDKNAGEVWIAWCQGIPEIVLDLIRNAVYAPSTFTDPWDPVRAGEADMWVQVGYHREHVLLTLANRCPLRVTELGSRLKSYRWQPLTDLGGSVIPIDIGPGLIGMQLNIPYAAYLKSSDRGSP